LVTPNPRRERLENELSDAYREVDKILVTVASGVVAVSVALIGNVKHPIDVWAIRASWMLMIGTVVAVLVSLLCEQVDKRRRIKKTYERRDEVDGLFTRGIKYLNVLSIVTFVLGLSSLGWFLWTNTKG
jgi:hypothetical protein